MTFLFTFSFQFLPPVLSPLIPAPSPLPPALSPLTPDPWPLTPTLSPLTSTNSYVRKNKLFLQNEPKFPKSQMNVTNLLTKNYEIMDTWSIRKNEPKTNPNEPKTNPILVPKLLNCVIYSTNISTGRLTPREIAFSMGCELVKITRPEFTTGPNYMIKASLNNWKAENL